MRKSWLYDQVEAGRLPHLRLGKQLRFRPREIADYLRQAAVAPSAPQDQPPKAG